jgi:hypothetical protein
MKRCNLEIVSVTAVLLSTPILTNTAAAQEVGQASTAAVAYEGPEIKTVYGERAVIVDLPFRVTAGYHINSN